jgi:hypothetical protein
VAYGRAAVVQAEEVNHVAAAALMPYVGCSRLWMCAPWSVLSTFDLFAVFVSLHVICGEQTVIPVPEVYLGHSISLFDCYSGPSPRPEGLSRVSDLCNCNPFEASALWMRPPSLFASSGDRKGTFRPEHSSTASRYPRQLRSPLKGH